MNTDTITFCVCEVPFICEVHGKFTIGDLEQIEKQFIEEPPNEWEYNTITITYECFWEESQYDELGQCEILGYWSLEEVLKIVVE